MLRIVMFELLQLGVSWFAIRRGGAPERIVGWMLLMAALATLAIGVPGNAYRGLSWLNFSIDFALFLGLLTIALRANRFWPYWMAAFELLGIGVHGARVLDPLFVPIVYSRLIGQVAYPMCLVLVLGTYHYTRRTRLLGAAPKPWATLRW